MSDQLFIQLQGETIRVLTLDMTLLSIGRTPDNGLPLPDQNVAIRHAEIRLIDGRFALTDLGNGETLVGGRKIPPFQPHVLDEGSLIQMGPYVLAYLPNQEDEAPPIFPTIEIQPRVFIQHLLAPALQKYTPTGPKTSKSNYLQFLPTLFEESEFLARYLLIFETIWEPLQQRQDFLHMYFNAGTAPDSVLSWIAGWVDIDFDPYWPEQRKRLWLKEAMQLVRWRGTRYGLRRAIELGIGITPHFETDAERPYFIRVLIADPESQENLEQSRDSIRNFVARHMPAHVLYEVLFIPHGADEKFSDVSD